MFVIEVRLLIFASGLALLRVRPPLFMDDTRFGLVSPGLSESELKLMSISGISERGEVTMGILSQGSSMFISPEEGSSMMEGLVSLRLNPPPANCLRLPVAVRLELADTDLLKDEFLDSVMDWVEERPEPCSVFISPKLFLSSPRLDFTSAVDSAARLCPLSELKQIQRVSITLEFTVSALTQYLKLGNLH